MLGGQLLTLQPVALLGHRTPSTHASLSAAPTAPTPALSSKQAPGFPSEHTFVILAWLWNNFTRNMLGEEISLKVG